MTKEFLISTIRDYEKGGLKNEDFLKKAHSIYNEYATYPSPLPNAENPYLLGCIFSAFAQYYSNNIDYYTCIIENALFCFCKVIKESASTIEKQCAAIRMLLLIDDNNWVMKGIVHKFYEKRCYELYGQPLMVQQMLSQGMEPWTFETDILKHIACYCINESDSDCEHACISSIEMQHFNNIIQSNKYNIRFPLVNVSADQVFDLLFRFIKDYIETPYERRITQLHYEL